MEIGRLRCVRAGHKGTITRILRQFDEEEIQSVENANELTFFVPRADFGPI